MKIQEALAACEETVRRSDPDRYFASLFAPTAVRPSLFALYAFNHEVARVGEVSHEPMLGAVRLQWWRETVLEAREARPSEHPVAIGLVELFLRAPRAGPNFESLLDAREFDLGSDTFADLRAFEAYCDATSGGVMRVAAQVLGSEVGGWDFLRHAGIAYAIVGLLRAIPFHAARGRTFLPLDLLATAGVSIDEIAAGRNSPSLKRVMHNLAGVAREHMALARTHRADSKMLLAALPAALTHLYLSRVTRRRFDPFRDSSDVPLFRRQLALGRAAAFRQI